MDVGIRRIMQVALTVDDVELAVPFYRDVLGLRHLFTSGSLAFFDCGGTRVLVSDENKSATRTLLYFEVADIHASALALSAKGVVFDEAPHVVAKLEDRDVWLASFRDPNGTVHLLMSEGPSSPARN